MLLIDKYNRIVLDKLPADVKTEVTQIYNDTSKFTDEEMTDIYKDNFNELYKIIEEKHPEALKAKMKLVKKSKEKIVKKVPIKKVLVKKAPSAKEMEKAFGKEFMASKDKGTLKTYPEHKYKLGETYRSDFDYDGMLQMGLTTDVAWGAEKLRKLFESYQDVNYHTPAAPLHEAVLALKDGDTKKAEKALKEFHKLVKKEITGDVAEESGDKEVYIDKKGKKFVVKSVATKALWANETFDTIKEAHDFIEQNSLHLAKAEAHEDVECAEAVATIHAQQKHKKELAKAREEKPKKKVSIIAREHIAKGFSAFLKTSALKSERKLAEALAKSITKTFTEYNPKFTEALSKELDASIEKQYTPKLEFGGPIKCGSTTRPALKYLLTRELTDYEIAYLTTHGIDVEENEDNEIVLSTSPSVKSKLTNEIQAIFEDALGTKKEYDLTVSSEPEFTTKTFSKGGQIENQYVGKTPSEIWALLDIKQRSHFLSDHSQTIFGKLEADFTEADYKQLSKYLKMDYFNFPPVLKSAFDDHVEIGEYFLGGKLKSLFSKKPKNKTEKLKGYGISFIIQPQSGESELIYFPYKKLDEAERAYEQHLENKKIYFTERMENESFFNEIHNEFKKQGKGHDKEQEKKYSESKILGMSLKEFPIKGYDKFGGIPDGEEIVLKEWNPENKKYLKFGGRVSEMFGKAKAHVKKGYHAVKGAYEDTAETRATIKKHAKKGYETAAKYGKEGYEKTKEGFEAAKQFTKDKIHHQQKNIALNVLQETRSLVKKDRDSILLNEAFNLVEENWFPGLKLGGKLTQITESDIVEGAKFKFKGGTIFIIDKVYKDEKHGMLVESSLEGGKKGNYRDSVKDVVLFFNEEGASKLSTKPGHVFTKDGIEVEKGSDKYKGQVFYDVEGGQYKCLGYEPSLKECLWKNLKTGQSDITGCVDGFFYYDPTKDEVHITLVKNDNKIEYRGSYKGIVFAGEGEFEGEDGIYKKIESEFEASGSKIDKAAMAKIRQKLLIELSKAGIKLEKGGRITSKPEPNWLYNPFG